MEKSQLLAWAWSSPGLSWSLGEGSREWKILSVSPSICNTAFLNQSIKKFLSAQKQQQGGFAKPQEAAAASRPGQEQTWARLLGASGCLSLERCNSPSTGAEWGFLTFHKPCPLWSLSSAVLPGLPPPHHAPRGSAASIPQHHLSSASQRMLPWLALHFSPPLPPPTLPRTVPEPWRLLPHPPSGGLDHRALPGSPHGGSCSLLLQLQGRKAQCGWNSWPVTDPSQW